MATIDNVRRGKVLGAGAIGTVYAATHGGREYAIKIERIPLSAVARQIAIERAFQRRVAAKHPAQFMQLYDIRHERDCEHEQQLNPKHGPPNVEQKRRAKSAHCIIRLYDRVGPSMNAWFRKLPPAGPEGGVRAADHKRIYSAVAQIIGIAIHIGAAGFHHDDLHTGNIATRRATGKTINILGRRVPTFGTIFCAIDFGDISHPKFAPGRYEKQKRRDGVEEIDALIVGLMSTNMWLYVRKHKIKMNREEHEKKFAAMPEYRYIREMTSKSLWLFVFMMLHPAAHYAMALPQLSPAVRAKFTEDCHIPREHIMALVAMRRDLPRALDYFAVLLKAAK